MKISVDLDNGLLPDRFGKFAAPEFANEGHPVRSFPIAIADVPAGAKSLALTFLDWDAIPVGGFCWIHWLACNIDPACTLIPENNSISGEVACVQGSNSNWSPFIGGSDNPDVVCRYSGPCPPDKTHVYSLYLYALDCKLDFEEGYYLNEFLHAIEGHVIDAARVELPSRA